MLNEWCSLSCFLIVNVMQNVTNKHVWIQKTTTNILHIQPWAWTKNVKLQTAWFLSKHNYSAMHCKHLTNRYTAWKWQGTKIDEDSQNGVGQGRNVWMVCKGENQEHNLTWDTKPISFRQPPHGTDNDEANKCILAQENPRSSSTGRVTVRTFWALIRTFYPDENQINKDTVDRDSDNPWD